jgi:SH3-like domain-containing protein
VKILWILLSLTVTAVAHAQAVCSRSAVSLHKAPSASSPVSWKVPKNMPFLRMERKGGWVKVQDLEGETHWARSSDLTSKIRCVVVKTAVAALHKDPSPNSPATDFKTLDRYTPLKRVADQSEWLRVEDEAGHLAWIHESQVWKPVMVNAFSF